MPAMPKGEGVIDGILQGGYCWRRSAVKEVDAPSVNLLASGSIMRQAIAAGELLEARGCKVNIWSITSYTELAREAEACERFNRLHPDAEPRTAYVRKLFADENDSVLVAASDYMKALPNSIARWLPKCFVALGTDGFGLSESREALRDHFEISSAYIAAAALEALYRDGRVDKTSLLAHLHDLGIDADKSAAEDR